MEAIGALKHPWKIGLTPVTNRTYSIEQLYVYDPDQDSGCAGIPVSAGTGRVPLEQCGYR